MKDLRLPGVIRSCEGCIFAHAVLWFKKHLRNGRIYDDEEIAKRYTLSREVMVALPSIDQEKNCSLVLREINQSQGRCTDSVHSGIVSGITKRIRVSW